IIGNPSLNHRYRKGFYSLFKTLQQNQIIKEGDKISRLKNHFFFLQTDSRIFLNWESYSLQSLKKV
ncbi:hypothetical protein SJ709_14940, partial [Enterococcus faecium]